MTIVALDTEASGVGIVRLMAAVAIFGNLILIISAAVASNAGRLGMNAEQLIACLFEMIVFRGIPFLGHVTFATIGAACAAVIIVGGVATHAILWRRIILAADMTGVASDRRVHTGEIKFRFTVIEFPTAPAQRAVAFAA